MPLQCDLQSRMLGNSSNSVGVVIEHSRRARSASGELSHEVHRNNRGPRLEHARVRRSGGATPA